MTMRRITEFVQFFWMFESHAEQRKMWQDAAEARVARARAEARAEEQTRAMLTAHPEGALGGSAFNDLDALRESGLL